MRFTAAATVCKVSSIVADEDSSKSRVGITDTSGAFVIRNVESGHYLVNVRRIEAGEFNVLVTTVARIRKALHCSWDELVPRGWK